MVIFCSNNTILGVLFHNKHIPMVHRWKRNLKICKNTIFSDVSEIYVTFLIMTFVYFSRQGRSFMLTAKPWVQNTSFLLSAYQGSS